MRSMATSVSSASTLAPRAPISGTLVGLGLVHLDVFLQRMDEFLLRSSGEIVVSAISRSATTGFLSLSRSTVIGAPDEIVRARWLASSTRSKRFSTLSMQSSNGDTGHSLATPCNGGTFGELAMRYIRPGKSASQKGRPCDGVSPEPNLPGATKYTVRRAGPPGARARNGHVQIPVSGENLGLAPQQASVTPATGTAPPSARLILSAERQRDRLAPASRRRAGVPVDTDPISSRARGGTAGETFDRMAFDNERNPNVRTIGKDRPVH